MESHEDQVSRVEQMAEDERGSKWDLSDNDLAALKAVLADRAALLSALQGLGAKPDGYCFCLDAEQIAAGHTGECLEAQAAIKQATQ